MRNCTEAIGIFGLWSPMTQCGSLAGFFWFCVFVGLPIIAAIYLLCVLIALLCGGAAWLWNAVANKLKIET